MTKQTKLILGLFVSLFGIGLTSWLWLEKGPSPASVPSPKTVGQPVPGAPTANQSSQPGTPPFQSPTGSSPVASPKKSFARLPVLERNAILEEIRKKDFPSILRAMLDAGRIEHDGTKQSAIQTILASAMRERTPPPEFLEQLRGELENNANSDFERQLIVGALGATATEVTTDFLIQLATTAPDKALRQLAGGSLTGAGAMEGAGVKLAPAIEKIWRESDDQALILSVSGPMAKIGAPSSMELLLAAALAPDGQQNLRKGAALGALGEVFQPRAVPPLAALLAESTPTSPASKLAGRVLVNIGDMTAGAALIAWLQTVDENAAPLAHEWVLTTRTPALLQSWSAALDQKISFQSPKIREVIRESLAERLQGRSPPISGHP